MRRRHRANAARWTATIPTEPPAGTVLPEMSAAIGVSSTSAMAADRARRRPQRRVELAPRCAWRDERAHLGLDCSPGRRPTKQERAADARSASRRSTPWRANWTLEDPVGYAAGGCRPSGSEMNSDAAKSSACFGACRILDKDDAVDAATAIARGRRCPAFCTRYFVPYSITVRAREEPSQSAAFDGDRRRLNACSARAQRAGRPNGFNRYRAAMPCYTGAVSIRMGIVARLPHFWSPPEGRAPAA